MAMKNLPWPGVQVFEVPSASQAIAGSSTNIAGFIGVLATRDIQIAVPNKNYDPTYRTNLYKDLVKNNQRVYKYFLPDWAQPAGYVASDATTAQGGGAGGTPTVASSAATTPPTSNTTPPPPGGATTPPPAGKGTEKTPPANKGTDTPSTEGGGTGGGNEPAAAADGDPMDQPWSLEGKRILAEPLTVYMFTNYSDFMRIFGEEIAIPDVDGLYEGQRNLAHGVRGYFANGGTTCYVVYGESANDIDNALELFKGVDDISILVAPGLTDPMVWDLMKQHCEQMKDRFAIFDLDENPGGAINNFGLLDASKARPGLDGFPQRTKHGAVYFPYIQVSEPAFIVADPENYRGDKARSYISPTGHMAGVYARTDVDRGVHKAPANTAVNGALGLRMKISKELQGNLNPDGINCIRDINGGINVWGARTIGGDANGEWRYVNVRRTFINIMEEIDKGMQWVVFEPNTPELWGKIILNVNAYLTGRWRQGALFGTAPEQAFFVKCDAETNPPADRENGIVRTVIGVAIVRPAEFVIFEISQMAQQA